MTEHSQANKKTRRVQARTLNTRAAITRVALNEFASAGFDGASTRRIAELAGVKHTLISHHFGGKEALWKATAQYAFELYDNRIKTQQAEFSSLDTAQSLRRQLREFILFSAEVPQFHRFMLQASQGQLERLQWLIENFISQGSRSEMSLLSAAQKAGVFVKGDEVHLRYLFIGAATSIFSLANEFEIVTELNPFSETVVTRHIELLEKLFLGGK